ncbi:Bug family tripartite tricarboxylate transporter substrate binding protein [Candidimonas nitroreducens]|uniref:ABC transporter substrate-binding protein n=1 Tax=Candidimonas nitroreducens TaxID=683354 RepID=A0A225M0N3_9BURK|nr:tripartite tricarboxylate transporter substrate binding protein [Candidimonas nitroreducens]OWT53773.1 hypothetical protein CEY11_23950 [Candidimonas nitroreducens]
MHRRKLLLAALPALLLSTHAPARAESWPAEPIKLVVAYPPGGSTDTAGRLLAKALAASLGRQVVVENRAGAGGTIGASYVAHAKPDGYTILLAASPEVSIAPITLKNMPYDPLKDLAPISLVGKVPFVLVVNPKVPAKSLQELIAYAKAHPGQLNYSSFGTNTSNHLIGEEFKVAAHINTTHVPYKGSGPSIADLMGGQVQYTFDTATATLGQVKAGRLRALAVATDKRLPNAPSIPTMAEAGLPFVGGTWFGLLAPAKTPQAVIDKLNAVTVAALKSPELNKAFMDLNIMPSPDTPAQFRGFISSEIGKWRSLASKVGIVAK